MSIVFYNRDTNCGVCFNPYSPEYLQSHSDILFVFADNLIRTGSAGQAIIRYEPNAIGVATKRLPTNRPEAFMTGTLDDYRSIESDFILIRNLAESGRQLVFPSTGLGTGLARLATTAPDLLDYIDSEVTKLIGTPYRLVRAYQR